MILPILRKWQKCLNVAFSNINLTGNRGKILKIFLEREQFYTQMLIHSDTIFVKYSFVIQNSCGRIFQNIFSSTETYFSFGDMSVLWS